MFSIYLSRFLLFYLIFFLLCDNFVIPKLIDAFDYKYKDINAETSCALWEYYIQTSRSINQLHGEFAILSYILIGSLGIVDLVLRSFTL